MNAKFVRSEHLLWMIPILYGIVVHFTSYTEIVMSFYSGAYFLISFTELCICFLIVLILPYITHWELRDQKLRHPILAWAHIILSTGIIVSILFIYSFTLPINVKWVYYTGILPAVAKWSYYNAIAIVLIKAFLVVQVVFLGYGVTRLVMHARAQNTNAYEENEFDELQNDGMQQQMIA